MGKGTDRFVVQKGELLSKGADYEIYRSVRGAFEILRLHGKCGPKLLSELRDKLLKQSRHLALDIASLSDTGFPMARDLVLNARRYRNSGKHLVLLNARGPFRDLVRASGPEGLVAFVVSEKLLEGDIPAYVKRMSDIRRQVSLIRTEVENNPAWQLVDREQIWLCPFCGALQDHLRFNPRQLIHDVTIEMLWLHLAEECPDYRAGKGLKNMSDLTDLIRRSNQDKLTASRTTATALANRVVELQDRVREVEDMEESFKVAASRQRHLLPSKIPKIPEVVAALGYWPANRVSGDFYDFLELGEDRYAFLIGDVSGHGIEAAILMGVAKKVTSIRMRDTVDCALALQMANRDIYPDLDRRTFVSAMLSVYDANTREFTYVRAGHNPTILYNPDRQPQFTKLESPGLVLGLDPGPRFNTVMQSETVQLQSGDTLFFYTDGLVEAQNLAGEEYQLPRVYERLRAGHEQSPQDVIQGMYEEVVAFRDGLPQEDDVTAFLLRLV